MRRRHLAAHYANSRNQGDVMAKWPTLERTVDDDGWSEQYNCYSKTVGPFRMSVAWSTDRQKPGYVVRVCDRTLKENAPDAATGKQQATALLRKYLINTLKELDEKKDKP